MIVNSTDKLLSNWRASPSQHVHCDIVQQCQNLLLEIFGFISFDYDLDVLGEYGSNQNELTKALYHFISSCALVFYAPRIVGIIYTKLSRQHREARATIERYVYQLIDNEMTQSKESRAQRKRTCLIASLVDSLQEDEKAEAKKSEDEKKGKSNLIYISLFRLKCFKLFIYCIALENNTFVTMRIFQVRQFSTVWERS